MKATKEMNVNLYSLKISTFDDEYGQWKTQLTSKILVDTRNDETYYGSDIIFREYEDYLKEYNEKLAKYGSRHDWEKPRLDMDWVANIDNADDLATMKRILGIGTEESKYLQTIYSKVQHYGGSEEGGWYYHTLEATTYTENDVEVDTDRYGEGYVKYNEFYFGEHENLERQHYC